MSVLNKAQGVKGEISGRDHRIIIWERGREKDRKYEREWDYQ
jgi:hypothetical protein